LEFIKTTFPNAFAVILSPYFGAVTVFVAVWFILVGCAGIWGRRKERTLQSPAKSLPVHQVTMGSNSPMQHADRDIVNQYTQPEASGSIKQVQKREPEFEFIGLGYPRHLHVSERHREGVVEPTTLDQEQNSISALTLKFTNTPRSNGKSSRALQVVAPLRFYSEGWNRYRDVDYGVWVNSPCDCTGMEVGAIQELVLIFINGEDYASPCDLRHDINKDYEVYFKLESVPWFRYVRVTLTDQITHARKTWVLHIWNNQGWCCSEIVPPSHVQQ
jgi:hypothetical protein